MAKIIVLGGGFGGLASAFGLQAKIGNAHEVTLINAAEKFQFTPSNPWVAVGWRSPEQVQVALRPPLEKRGIHFVVDPARAVQPADNRVELSDGRLLDYDFLVVTTGPQLAFDEIPGFGPNGYTHSVCTTPHATSAYEGYQRFLEKPGPVVVGAAQGASCFGPAYEFAMIVDADLRRRKLRHKVPMTFVTPEPYIGHLGLGGVGDSKGLLESALRERHIQWITNAKVKEVHAGDVVVIEHSATGEAMKEQTLPFAYCMMIPAFKGVNALMGVEGLVNPRGFTLIDAHQSNPRYPNVFSAGVCVAIAPPVPTPVPTGVPKTGYMIESMSSAVVENIAAALAGKAPEATATWNAICLADFGDTGMAFVALPQIPPRNVTWTKEGKWVHVAKVAFEKYYLGKVKRGAVEPFYETTILKSLGIKRLAS